MLHMQGVVIPCRRRRPHILSGVEIALRGHHIFQARGEKQRAAQDHTTKSTSPSLQSESGSLIYDEDADGLARYQFRPIRETPVTSRANSVDSDLGATGGRDLQSYIQHDGEDNYRGGYRGDDDLPSEALPDWGLIRSRQGSPDVPDSDSDIGDHQDVVDLYHYNVDLLAEALPDWDLIRIGQGIPSPVPHVGPPLAPLGLPPSPPPAPPVVPIVRPNRRRRRAGRTVGRLVYNWDTGKLERQ